MAFFPSGLTITSFKEKTSRPVLKSQYDGGYTVRRPKYTRQVKTFSLGFSALTIAQASELETFIMDNQGMSFTFTHPTTLVTYEVTNTTDEIEFSFIPPKYRSTSIVLEEV